MKVSNMSKVKMGFCTMYTADTFCDECGWDINDLSFNSFVPRIVFASDVEECPYCVVRCDEQNKPMILENGEVVDYTPHWFVFGAHNDHEISCSEVFDWLNCT